MSPQARRFWAGFALWIGAILLLLSSCHKDGTEPTPAPASITILPQSDTVDLGASTTLHATVTDATGAPLPDAPLTWASSNTEVASVTAAGIVLGVGLGVTSISAASGSVRATADITVQQPLPTSLRGLIVFSSGRDGNAEIYAVRPDGSALVNFTRSPLLEERYPAISPDGSLLAFNSDSDHTRGNFCDPKSVVVMSVEGRTRTKMLEDQVCSGSSLTWSPEGAWIAVGQIGSSPIAGFGTKFVSPDGTEGGGLSCSFGFAGGVDWAPDGQRYVYSCFVVSDADLIVAGQNTPKYYLTSDPARDDGGAAWSPDAATIAFIGALHDGSSQGGIFVIRPDGQGLAQVSDRRALKLAWSPDGSRIAFHESGGIYVMHPDGSALERVTPDSLGVTEGPVWSPEGHQVAFGATMSGDPEVFVINDDGSGLTNLSHSAGPDQDVGWGR